MTREILELERVSIGVTTGSVYVGVIGHHERHEYSFLGPKLSVENTLRIYLFIFSLMETFSNLKFLQQKLVALKSRAFISNH